ncbi:RTA1 like protein [Colletotrichum sojae]|uniref:RTA1 like protein n=1 Tax=Colletotrichum sojae TaxID=2175907 RepID=A0A8H6JF14_9PEZI|nr:RTA1 like protein [Colletotrichum sojae]
MALSYPFDPAIVPSGVLSSYFGLIAIFHTFKTARSGAWAMIPFCVGAWSGHMARFFSALESLAHDPSLVTYLFQAILTLSAPALFAASLYQRLVCAVVPDRKMGPNHQRRRQRRCLLVFWICGEAVSSLLKACGVYFMTADSEVPVGIGRELDARAIVVQVVLLAVAVTGAGVCFARTFRARSQRPADITIPDRGQLPLITLCLVALLLRSTLHLVAHDDDAFHQRESLRYVVEACLMVAVAAAGFFVYPNDAGAGAVKDGEEARSMVNYGPVY